MTVTAFLLSKNGQAEKQAKKQRTKQSYAFKQTNTVETADLSTSMWRKSGYVQKEKPFHKKI